MTYQCVALVYTHLPSSCAKMYPNQPKSVWTAGRLKRKPCCTQLWQMLVILSLSKAVVQSTKHCNLFLTHELSWWGLWDSHAVRTETRVRWGKFTPRAQSWCHVSAALIVHCSAALMRCSRSLCFTITSAVSLEVTKWGKLTKLHVQRSQTALSLETEEEFNPLFKV